MNRTGPRIAKFDALDNLATFHAHAMDATADHEKAAARVIRLMEQLDVAKERLDATPAEPGDG